MAIPREQPLSLDMTYVEVLEGFAPGNVELVGEPPTNLGKASPFVKWAGGKRSIIEELVRRIPTTFNRYWEPFVGGGALFFELQPRLTAVTLSDYNFELMVTYNTIKRDPLSLIGKLEVHAIRHGKAYYYKVRKRRKIQDSFELAARFLYLNKTCYNGLYRVNRKGEFNVPIGSYGNPEIVQRENILACAAAVATTQLDYREFDTITPDAGDFVYCDPPYHPVNSTSFTKYTQLEFREAEQQRLQHFALQLHQRGVKIMLSNSDTPLIRDLYRGRPWQLATVQAPRIVNCKPDGRGAINELVITNYSV
jgi:DNA adenine methylase